MSLGTVAVWTVSRTTELPITPWTPGGTEPVGALDLGATASELFTAVMALVALAKTRNRIARH